MVQALGLLEKTPPPERFPRGEAVHFREHALELGVPDAAILLEPQARNTGQNITLSRQVLAQAGITPTTVLLVSMPYMERRSFATARKLWPEVEIVCASEPLEFDDYLKSIGARNSSPTNSSATSSG